MYPLTVIDDTPESIKQITLGQILVVLVFLVAVISLFLWVASKIKPFSTGLRNFLEDWNGVPPRPGVDRRPGVMERLDKLEETTAEVKHEIKPNRGGSLADEIYRIGDKVGTKHGELHSRTPGVGAPEEGD